MTASATLSRFITQCRYDDIPVKVLERARLHLLDTLGVALAGTVQANARHARAGLMRLPGSAGEIPVWGSNLKLSPTNAALANGIAAHVLDYDDTHTDSITHSSAVLTPTALALAQSLGKDSHAFLTAWVVGWEVAARVGLASHSGFHQRGFHATAIAGVFGAVACAASLLELNARQTCHALGLAGSQAAGITEFLSNSSSSKCFHAGWAAQSGIIAACLAQGGMTGPESVFEGRFGLYTTHGVRDNADIAAISAELGARWEMLNVSIKPYPCCHFAHATVDCARMLRRDGIQAEQIRQIECVVDPIAAALICEPPEQKKAPQTPYAAKFSLPWLMAAGFYDDNITLASLDVSKLARPELLALADKVTHRYPQPGEIVFPRYFPGLIYVHLHDGTVLTRQLAINYGNPDNPMSAQDVQHKFLTNVEGIISNTTAQQIVQLVADDSAYAMEKLANLLTQITTPDE